MQAADTASAPPALRTRMLLVAILALAAGLRFPLLDRAPPGLNQDEAANAWNAWCLLNTGRDQVGVRWPIFYTRALGENKTTLYIYLLMPFQAAGAAIGKLLSIEAAGLNVWTTRLPNAVVGVASVWLIYWIGARLFDRAVGLLAALLLAICPWSVFLSRWGLEAGLGGPVAMLAVAGVIWAGLVGDRPRRLSAWRALVAGLVTGIGCYGYAAVRLFMVAFVACAAFIVMPEARRKARAMGRPRGCWPAIAAWAIGFGLAFGPLAVRHVIDPEISRRGQGLWLWQPGDPVASTLAKIGHRYAAHFGPSFLAEIGDADEASWCSGNGVLLPAMLPLLAIGLLATARRAFGPPATRGAARLVLVWLLVYPAGDCLFSHMSAHALRSMPGLGALILIAATGGVAGWRWLKQQRLGALRLCGATALVLLALEQSTAFLHRIFVTRNSEVAVRMYHLSDLNEVCDWLRPGFEQFDAIYVTTRDLIMPFIVMLVGVNYDPERWLNDAKDVDYSGRFDIYKSFGKVRFLDPEQVAGVVSRLRGEPRTQRVLLILREDEADLEHPVFASKPIPGLARLAVYVLEPTRPTAPLSP